jgi:uncharacterized membrane protein YebE (DUF533 family)
MLDPEQLLGQMFSGALGNAFRGHGGYSLSSGMLGSKAEIGLGLLGLAVAAYEHHQQPGLSSTTAMPPPPPPGLSAMPPPPPVGAQDRSRSTTRELPVLTPQQQDAVVLIRAMIAAAHADGVLDADERARILSSASLTLNEQTRQFLDAELAAPRSVEQVIASGRPDLASEIYAASLHAITLDTDAEQLYLDKLAAGLQLSDFVRQQIHQQLGIA